jgi:hypothetical protein
MSALLMITQQTKDYFNIHDNKLTQCMLKHYIENTILQSENPKQKALEIWDLFIPQNVWYDVPPEFTTKEKLQEYRKIIETSDNATHYIFAFCLFGFSPFWSKNVLP